MNKIFSDLNWQRNEEKTLGIILSETLNTSIMAVRVVEFSDGVYKIRKIFAKKSTYPKEIIEFWELD